MTRPAVLAAPLVYPEGLAPPGEVEPVVGIAWTELQTDGVGAFDRSPGALWKAAVAAGFEVGYAGRYELGHFDVVVAGRCEPPLVPIRQMGLTAFRAAWIEGRPVDVTLLIAGWPRRAGGYRELVAMLKEIAAPEGYDDGTPPEGNAHG
jgi:hypothetical protein